MPLLLPGSSPPPPPRSLTCELVILSPQIPDEVTNYFLSLSGFECPDERVTRLVSLATHKFVADLTNDALQHCKVRNQAKSGKAEGADTRLVLTTEDLANSCKEYGIQLRKPAYYADTPARGGAALVPSTQGESSSAPH